MATRSVSLSAVKVSLRIIPLCFTALNSTLLIKACDVNLKWLMGVLLMNGLCPWPSVHYDVMSDILHLNAFNRLWRSNRRRMAYDIKNALSKQDGGRNDNTNSETAHSSHCTDKKLLGWHLSWNLVHDKQTITRSDNHVSVEHAENANATRCCSVALPQVANFEPCREDYPLIIKRRIMHSYCSRALFWTRGHNQQDWASALEGRGEFVL